jgi:hypothetical protein
VLRSSFNDSGCAIDARYFRIRFYVTDTFAGGSKRLGAAPEGIAEALASSAFRGVGFALPFCACVSFPVASEAAMARGC